MDELINEIIKLERHLIKDETRRSIEELDKYLADDFLEIPSTGQPYIKKDALARIPTDESPVFVQQDYRLNILVDDLVQLIYKVAIKRASGSISYSWRSSIWRKSNGRWQMLFHQGTPCEKFEINH